MTLADCPACYEKGSAVWITSHLLMEHAWDYQRSMDWLRAHEEREDDNDL